MRIYPASHYTMGGLWVDYNLMSTIPGLFVLGEANFSDHGANRLGASALMQGLADGYFVIPYTIGNYLAREKFEKIPDEPPRVRGGGGRRRLAHEAPARGEGQADRRRPSTASSARSCGTTAAWRATRRASSTASSKIPELREEFWKNVKRPGLRPGAQPVARERRPRGRLPRARRAHVPRRARARRILRRPLPRGAPDAGRRGEARRRALLPRGGLGVHGRREEAQPAQGAPDLRERRARVRSYK